MFDRQFFDVIGLLLHGVVATFYITLSCFITAFALGLGVAVLRRLSGQRTGAVLSALVFIVRSIPVLVLLFLVYFGLPSLGIRPSPMIAMNLSLGVIGGAYISEVFRGALGSVEHTERVAAQSMGFSDLQVVFHIELPQMLRFSLPGVMNELTAIFEKHTLRLHRRFHRDPRASQGTHGLHLTGREHLPGGGPDVFLHL
ncbi:ABC transporter permease subunit [Pseudomonas tolaasii]